MSDLDKFITGAVLVPFATSVRDRLAAASERIDVVEQASGTADAHTHTIAEVSGLSSNLDNMQGEIDAIELLLAADDANFDTAQERLTELKRLAGLIGSLGITQISGLRTELDSLAGMQSEIDAIEQILSVSGTTFNTAQKRATELVRLSSLVSALEGSTYMPVSSFAGNTYSRVVTEWLGNEIEFVAKSGANLTVDPRTQNANGPANWTMRQAGGVPVWEVEHSAYYFADPSMIVRASSDTTQIYSIRPGSTQSDLEVNPTTDVSPVIVNGEEVYYGWAALGGVSTVPASTGVVPVISGIGYAGQTITVTNVLDFEGGFSGQWYADGVAVSGETGSTLTVTGALNGAAIYYKKTADGSTTTSNQIHHFTIADTTAALWLDMAATNSLTLTGTDIDGISDLSGNGRGVTEDTANGYGQPVYDSANAVANGLPAMVMAPSSSMSKTPVFKSEQVFVVAAFRDGTDTTTSSRRTLLAYASNKPRIRITQHGSTIESDSLALSSEVFINGETTGTATLLPMPLNLMRFDYPAETETLCVLSDPTGTRAWDGPMTEIVLLDTAADTATREKIEGYLCHKNKLALPSGHTYENQPPNA